MVVLLICTNGKHMVNNYSNFYIIISHNVGMQHDMIEMAGRALGNETSLQT